ncbi:MAG: hypothetical protein LBQ54_15615 [Planctomycetaceae bacterium]|jgi:hypothetical protein|nr:hypothetical protein [Planctomycetaceae bacterium]
MKHRFTLSRHETNDGSHWDLFLEALFSLDALDKQNEKLWTWQITDIEAVLQVLARQKQNFLVTAVRAADHRNIYLDYEGTISGNRGAVTIFATGSYGVAENLRRQFSIETESRQLSGRWSFLLNDMVENGAEIWTIRFSGCRAYEH